MDIVNRERNIIRLRDIDVGECFRFEGFLYIKTDRGDLCSCTHDCVRLTDGSKETLSSESVVQDVVATIITGETPTTLMQKGMI